MSLPKFGNYFLQLIIDTALKFLTLTKFFILQPKKYWFCLNIFLSVPEKFIFAQILESLGDISPFSPARYGHERNTLRKPAEYSLKELLKVLKQVFDA